MISQLIFVTSVLAIANCGLLLGDGFGYGGGYGLSSGIGLGVSSGYVGYGKQSVVDYYAPPKYEYKYAVEDPHTADLKEQVESRVGDLTKSDYAVAEKDRQTRVSRVIAGSAPLVSKGYGY